jgi:hypothetical protein
VSRIDDYFSSSHRCPCSLNTGSADPTLASICKGPATGTTVTSSLQAMSRPLVTTGRPPEHGAVDDRSARARSGTAVVVSKCLCAVPLLFRFLDCLGDFFSVLG